MAEPNLELLDRLEICGLTQREAATYLTARGHKASFGSVQAWAKGLYKMPPGIVDDLELLRRIIWETDAEEDDKGVRLPDGCIVRRRQVRRTKPLSGAALTSFEKFFRSLPPPADVPDGFYDE